jgi:hypothetical protein
MDLKNITKIHEDLLYERLDKLDAEGLQSSKEFILIDAELDRRADIRNKAVERMRAEKAAA